MALSFLALLVAFTSLFVSSDIARACALDNRSSLSANGFAALKNLDLPTGNLALWAPFVFNRVYGQSQSISFQENMNDLKKNLTPQELQHPFLWRWGDGTKSEGLVASHAYRRTGSYVVAVYAYVTGTAQPNRWVPFDRAKVKIVPAGEVWRDNLGWTLLDMVGFVGKWTYWLIATAVALLLAYGFWEDWRRRHSRGDAGP